MKRSSCGREWESREVLLTDSNRDRFLLVLFDQVGRNDKRLFIRVLRENGLDDRQAEGMLPGNAGAAVTGGVDGMAAVLFVPLGEVCGLVHVLDYLPPADARVVGTEADLALLSAVGNDTHLCAAEVVIEKILEPHTFNTQHTPDVVWIVGNFGFHAVVAIRAGIRRRRFEEIEDLRNRKSFGSALSVEVAHDRHSQ